MNKKGNNPPLAVGITGGIGAGKTFVTRYFRQFGIPVYSADEEAKRIIHNDTTLKQSIIQLLGSDAYLPDGQYNSTWVAQQIFKDAALRYALNLLVHPAVLRDAQQWHQNQSSAYTIREAALLIQSGHTAHLDYLIVVVAPAEIRTQRVMARSRLTGDQVEARMKAQLTDKQMIQHADFIINNDGTASVEKQVAYIHKVLLNRYALT